MPRKIPTVECDGCGSRYRVTSGGHCTECHRTFASIMNADGHRSSGACLDVDDDYRFQPDGTVEKVRWRLNDHGEWTDAPPWRGRVSAPESGP